ncbi:BnaC03g23190D [Brassica napus]|uniref:Uncharacterized protein n=2 Tax=Brassica TaxID=3705 RepID=A0A3P6FK67_BRAOL|nr:unnamed protein product [Brassica napus]CDY22509.1 BnaC03g23190D [Brassica napus]VDD58443.1 unnamed protein product [Brassica oleracea]
MSNTILLLLLPTQFSYISPTILNDCDSFEMILADQWVLMLDQKSSEDCPTPITKRKVDHSDLTDISSSSKKLCTKMIKQEKEKKE